MTMLPTEKMQHQNVTEGFRPMTSAIGAAIRAPINVPIESCVWLAEDRAKQYGRVTDHSYDETGSDVAEVSCAITVVLAKSVEEIWQLQETGDLTSIISEDEASH